MACSKLGKKRKVDSENREFKAEWTEKYAFVLPAGSMKPMCLICHETVALIKSGNVKRHYETKHGHFERSYPQNSEVRTRKINQMQESYQASRTVIVRSATQQERATEASLRVAWVLGKHKKPFTDAEVVKECMNEIAIALYEGTQFKDDITVENPFLVKNVTEFSTEALKVCPWASAASLQTELVELQENLALRESLRDPATFWTKMAPAGVLQKMALQILTMFPSTYSCESAFSTMTMVKNKYRGNLTNEHLHQCLRLALTPFVPKFKELVAQKKCNFSH